MFPEMILIVAGVIALITFVYVYEEKIRELFGLPQRAPKWKVRTFDSAFGQFRSIDDGDWTCNFENVTWQAKNVDGVPSPDFLSRIPDIQKVLPVWDALVRADEDGLEEYALTGVDQGEEDDEVVLTFDIPGEEEATVLFVTLRSGEVVEKSWMH